MTWILTKQYISITHKAQKRNEKVLKQATLSMIPEDKLAIFLELLDHITDTTIKNYIMAVGKFKLASNIDTPDTEVFYYYGSNPSEIIFRNVAKFLKVHYKNATVICLQGKGHCEDALMNAQQRILEMNRVLL